MPNLQMDYDQVMTMISALRKSAESINGSAQVMRRIADILDSGALVNNRGKEWSDALRGPMFNRLMRAQDMLEEMARDVEGSLRDMQSGDVTGGNEFRS